MKILLDVAGKLKEEVLNKVFNLINDYRSKLKYNYIEPAKEQFYPWVQSDGLR